MTRDSVKDDFREHHPIWVFTEDKRCPPTLGAAWLGQVDP